MLEAKRGGEKRVSAAAVLFSCLTSLLSPHFSRYVSGARARCHLSVQIPIIWANFGDLRDGISSTSGASDVVAFQ